MAYRVARIVQPGKSNTKIAHGERWDIRSCTISLASSDSSGFNMCPRAMPRSRIDELLASGLSWDQIFAIAQEAGLSMCSGPCVTHTSGKGSADFVREPRENLTRWYQEDRQSFREHVVDEMRAECRIASRKDQVVGCRPNLNSDVPWERTVPELFDLPAHYWDYTKVSKRLGKTPDNYHLTYSVNDGTLPEDWQNVYDSGCNIAVVFDTWWQPSGPEHARKFGCLPTWYTDPNGYRWRVIDGDKSDFRFLDDGPVCVGLRLKGHIWERTLARMSGFAVQVPRALRAWYWDTHPAEAA